MSTDIFDYPPVERKYVAVRRFKIIIGKSIYDDLLKYLGLTEKEFVNEYGEKIVANPTCLNRTIVEMVTSQIRESRKRRRNGL